MPSTRQQNRDLAERFYDTTPAEAQDMVDDVLAEEYVMHDSTMPEAIRGREAVKAYHRALSSAFSNLRSEVEDVVATDDTVVVRYTIRGTHDRGEFMGVEPTGVAVTVTGIDILRVEDGRFVEGWSEMNVFSLLAQLGAVPDVRTELAPD